MNQNRKLLRCLFTWRRAKANPYLPKKYTPSIYKRYNNMKKYLIIAITIAVMEMVGLLWMFLM